MAGTDMEEQGVGQRPQTAAQNLYRAFSHHRLPPIIKDTA